MTNTRKCRLCNEVKQLEEFYIYSSGEKEYRCKVCFLIYRRSHKGIAIDIYNSQINSSKRRGYEPPNYNRHELELWIKSNKNYNNIYHNWVNHNYDINLKPSVDRIDDYKPYTFDNIQLITWGENNKKANSDRKNDINNKDSKAVLQYDLEGNFIKEYYSQSQAARELGITQSKISSCVLNRVKHIDGFIFRGRE